MIVFTQLIHETFMLAFVVGVLTGLCVAMLHWWYV